MHKIVTLDISTEKKRKVIPYLSEHVSFENSLSAIQKMLQRYQCDQIATVQKQVVDAKHGAFTIYSTAFIVRGEKFIIEFPVIFVKNSNEVVLRMDIAGRLIFYKIKSLLADVEIGHLDFAEAMIPFRIVTLPGGMQVPLSDYVRDHGDELSAGTADFLMLGK